MRRHLWYPSDDLIGLALFDDREKTTIVQAIKTRPELKNSSQRLQGMNLNVKGLLSTWASIVRSSNLIKGLLGEQTDPPLVSPWFSTFSKD